MPRLTLTLVDRGGGKLAIDAQVRIPEELRRALTDIVTGRTHEAQAGVLPASSLLQDFPVALLTS